MKILLLIIAVPLALGILETAFVTLRAFIKGGPSHAWRVLQGLEK
jgi:hypothetical protein